MHGVCGGIAEYLGISSTLIRIICLFALFYTIVHNNLIVLVIYFIFALAMPDSDSEDENKKWQDK